jgi:cytochrome c oxidase assembly protein subunit 15
MNDKTTDMSSPRYRPAPHYAALLATVLTWPLLFVGGLVTTYRVGMAVPDWPTTFGINMFLYDMTRASWAVFGEHTHRLYGAAVGFCVILLVLDFAWFERRPGIRWLGVVALVAVVAQGVLGGFRVRLNSTLLAAVHGSTAQAFFGFLVALCVLTGRSWIQPPTAVPAATRRRWVGLTLAAVGLISLMVLVGAWLRHYHSTLALALHAGLSVLVLGHCGALLTRVWTKRELPELVPASRALAATLTAQLILGVAAWWLLRPFDGTPRNVTLVQALIRTGHQANAGLLLASAVVLALRAYGPRVAVADVGPVPGPVVETRARDLEAVA